MADIEDVDSHSNDEVEHEHITTSVEIEKIDENLYRSKSLWLPTEARGVFGGQVISQALLAATKSVSEAFAAHSLHSYFLLSASPAQPIIYAVDRLRDGRTYATRSVRAKQFGKTVFMMVCSFQKPEPSSHSHQWPFPHDVPSPEKSETSSERYNRLIAKPGASGYQIKSLKDYADERSKSPIEIRLAKKTTGPHGSLVAMYWMRARNIPSFSAPFHKCILAYISDLHLLGTGARTVGLSWGKKPPNNLGMISTLDHSIWYYNHTFDCGDWLLYVMESPRVDMGRGLVHGRVYTQDGVLVAAVVQEGVIRPAMGDSHDTTSSKL